MLGTEDYRYDLRCTPVDEELIMEFQPALPIRKIIAYTNEKVVIFFMPQVGAKVNYAY